MQLVAIRFDANTVYRFLFAAPAGRLGEFQEGYRRATYSFRRLSAAEAAAAKPLRLRVVRVRPGDTVDSLARRMAYDTAQVRRFQVLNGLQPGQQPREGERVKLIDD